jgi:hypothetical protein
MKCCELVYHADGNWGRHYPCSRNATVEREGKYYCKTHDPVAVKARVGKRRAESEAKYAAELKRRQLERAAPDLLEACKELCARLEANELVNRPSNPCNHYDQPAYDRARAAIAKAEGGGGA